MRNRGDGKVTRVITRLPDKEIEELASTLSNEDDVLASFGLRKDQIERTKKNKRWRTCWDKGYAKGTIDKNKELYKSTEPSIQKIYAEKVMPQAFETDLIIEWKAPKWFYEEFDANKIKKARKEVVD